VTKDGFIGKSNLSLKITKKSDYCFRDFGTSRSRLLHVLVSTVGKFRDGEQ
jgi:hypothetical protein